MTIDERLMAAGLPPLSRRVWLEIDLEALTNNLQAIRDHVGPDVEINAVVKADAYGHGLVPVARHVAAAGAQRLCVASLDEALVVRGAGIATPILVMFSIPVDAVARAAQSRIEIVASDLATIRATLERWRTCTTSDDDVLAVHLEVETGLTRAGLKPDAVADVARLIAATPRTRLAGIWTHLATPEDEATSDAQETAFAAALDSLRAAGLAIPARHLAATGGLLIAEQSYEGIRPGLALYGIVPDSLVARGRQAQLAGRLRPVMTLKCTPLRVETFPAGTRVGYGGRWTAQRESIIATLPLGYGDGFARAYSPGAQAIVRGSRVPVVGTVAMDALMVDVTDVPGVTLDDEFVLLGRQGAQSIDANELARVRNTIPWEVVTAMSTRVTRVYHAGSVLKSLRTLDGELGASGEG